MQQPIPCPFCGQPSQLSRCASCSRDLTASRRICMKCGRATPTVEPKCMHCQTPFRGDMWWKIPLIIGLFIVSAILAAALAMIK